MSSFMAKVLLMSMALTILLSACGQKGALYLPQEPTAPASTSVENPPPPKP